MIGRDFRPWLSRFTYRPHVTWGTLVRSPRVDARVCPYARTHLEWPCTIEDLDIVEHDNADSQLARLESQLSLQRHTSLRIKATLSSNTLDSFCQVRSGILHKSSFGDVLGGTVANSSLILSTKDQQIDLPAFRVTKTWRPAGLRLARHSHENTHVAVCASGQFDELVGTRWRRVTPATLIIRPGGEAHADNYSYQSKAIIFELLPKAVHSLSQVTSVLRSARCIDADEVVSSVHRLRSELAQLDSVSSLAIEALLYELIVHASRDADSIDDSPRWFKRVTDYLHANFHRRVAMADLEDVAAVHSTHIATTFRARHRMTAAEYIRRLRIKRAAALLRDSKLALADIAAQCGFYDQSHFTRTFTKQMGISPHRFRKEVN